MPSPSTLRDSTQIVLPSDALEELRAELDERFTLTFFETDGTGAGTDGVPSETDTSYVRIIGSPVEIKAASDFLSQRGVTLP